jgi:hypothetical protein
LWQRRQREKERRLKKGKIGYQKMRNMFKVHFMCLKSNLSLWQDYDFLFFFQVERGVLFGLGRVQREERDGEGGSQAGDEEGERDSGGGRRKGQRGESSGFLNKDGRMLICHQLPSRLTRD